MITTANKNEPTAIPIISARLKAFSEDFSVGVVLGLELGVYTPWVGVGVGVGVGREVVEVELITKGFEVEVEMDEVNWVGVGVGSMVVVEVVEYSVVEVVVVTNLVVEVVAVVVVRDVVVVLEVVVVVVVVVVVAVVDVVKTVAQSFPESPEGQVQTAFKQVPPFCTHFGLQVNGKLKHTSTGLGHVTYPT